MTAIITRSGSGAAITESENDGNLDSLCGINEIKLGNYTVVSDDQNRTIECSNAGTTIITLDLIATIIAAIDTSDFKVTIKNVGAGDITLTPTTDTFDDGNATKTIKQFQYVTIQTDSTQGKWNVLTSDFIVGLTSTIAELNILTGVTSTAAELNILTGVTSTAAELNDLAGNAVDAADFTKLSQITASSTELNILTGKTSFEDGADITDTTNVTAAGALMDSEVDADIKTLALPASTTISAFGASLIDDADAAAARATLESPSFASGTFTFTSIASGATFSNTASHGLATISDSTKIMFGASVRGAVNSRDAVCYMGVGSSTTGADFETLVQAPMGAAAFTAILAIADGQIGITGRNDNGIAQTIIVHWWIAILP